MVLRHFVLPILRGRLRQVSLLSTNTFLFRVFESKNKYLTTFLELHRTEIVACGTLFCEIHQYSLETSAFEELGSEFINFASNCVINTLRLIVYLTGLSI